MSPRSGLSLLEVIIALALLAVVTTKLAMAIDATSQVAEVDAKRVDLEDQALRVLDQIAYAVMGSARDSLVPDGEVPLFDSEVNYEIHLGLLEGEVVVGDPERIGLGLQGTDLVWWQNPEELSERSVVWSRAVAPFLEGEISNGFDDNGNGLVDELGLSFAIQGDIVTIRLSLERSGSNGSIIETVMTRVTCRN